MFLRPTARPKGSGRVLWVTFLPDVRRLASGEQTGSRASRRGQALGFGQRTGSGFGVWGSSLSINDPSGTRRARLDKSRGSCLTVYLRKQRSARKFGDRTHRLFRRKALASGSNRHRAGDPACSGAVFWWSVAFERAISSQRVSNPSTLPCRARPQRRSDSTVGRTIEDSRRQKAR
jgi:hypothetical protein